MPCGVDAQVVVDGEVNISRRIVQTGAEPTWNDGPEDHQGRRHPYKFAAAALTGTSAVKVHHGG